MLVAIHCITPYLNQQRLRSSILLSYIIFCVTLVLGFKSVDNSLFLDNLDYYLRLDL